MKNKFIAFLSACACAGAVGAGVESVEPYDFNKIVVKGSDLGSATMTINGSAATIGSQSATEIVATGLSAGNVYKYAVTVGGDTTSGEITMGNGSGKLFGASATSGSGVETAGSWNTTAPCVAPTVKNNKYELLGSNSKFDVNDGVIDGNKKIVYIDSTMTFSDGADELDEPLEALGAFTLAQTNETVETDFFWAGLTGGTTKWVKLTGVKAGAGTYVSRMEFDFNQTHAKVRYSVGESVSALTVLKDAQGNEWFDANSSATSIASVAYEGTGSLASFEGSSLDASVAQVGSDKYTDIASALLAAKSQTLSAVTLFTNTRPVPNANLAGGSWTITGGYAVEPVETVGFTSTYTGNVLTMSVFTPSANVTSVRGDFGYDFTNGTLKVTVGGVSRQEVDQEKIIATVTVKDASGTSLGTIATQEITGNGTYDFAIPGSLMPTAGYTYEVAITKGETSLDDDKGSFVAANDSNWFSADQSNWTNHGSWKKNDEAVTVSGEKIELGGNQYDFTPTAPDISNVIVRVDTVIEINGAIDPEDLPTEGDVQGMIALVETDGETPAWQAYVGSTWKTLTGGDTEVGTYTIRAEFDYRGTAKTVRYSVAKDGGAFTVLKDGSNEWIDNGVQFATTLAGTSAMGAGNLVSLKGDNIDASVAEVDGVRYETMAAALAAADGKNVTLLWNCTWTPGVNGQWTIDAKGKTLIVYGADGWDFDYENDELQASNVKVAKVGDNEYYLIKKAFAAVPAEGGTVEMLTNLVQNVDVAVANNAILDLASWFVSGAGKLNVTDGKTLVFTNSTGVAGGFGMAGVADAGAKYSICGGKWVDNTGALGSNYKFIELAEKPTVDGVTYKYEAMFTTIDPTTPAKVYPVKDGDNSVGDAVVKDDFVKQHLPDITDPAEIATALNENRTTGNCLPLIQSYVLGLDPKVETAKPIVGAVQNADAAKVTLSLGNVEVNTAAGVPVQFSLSTATSPDFTGGTTGEKQDSSAFNVDIDSDKKLQYYKINIHFGK